MGALPPTLKSRGISTPPPGYFRPEETRARRGFHRSQDTPAGGIPGLPHALPRGSADKKEPARAGPAPVWCHRGRAGAQLGITSPVGWGVVAVSAGRIG